MSNRPTPDSPGLTNNDASHCSVEGDANATP